MVLENLFPPIPSELILPLAATSGSLLGALFLYGLGASTLRTLNFLEPPRGEVPGTTLPRCEYHERMAAGGAPRIGLTHIAEANVPSP